MIDTTKYPPRVSVERYLDGPDALPLATTPTVNDKRLPAGTPSIGFGITGAHELYRTRTMSHLYDEWMVEFVIDQARDTARSQGLVLADCHRCRLTQAVDFDADACPTCHGDL